MTLKTLLWFTSGGVFASLYANKVQGFHFLRSKYNYINCFLSIQILNEGSVDLCTLMELIIAE